MTTGDFFYSPVQRYGTNGSPPYYYTGSNNIGGYDGEWLGILFPYDVKIKKIGMTARNGEVTSAPKAGYFLGTVDNGNTWETIGSFSNKTSTNFWLDSGVQAPTFDVNANNQFYNGFVFVCTEASNYYAFTLGEIRIFGTPAPSTLDDGHLTLGKQLTLPRISGHAPDAETPRAESLIVHYDTTVDSVVSGSAVVDSSGSGNEGTKYNGVGYSTMERAFEWNNSTAARRIQVNGVPTATGAGNFTLTVSMWFKLKAVPASGSSMILWGMVGENDGTDGSPSGYSVPHSTIQADGDITWAMWGNDVDSPVGVVANRWYHCVWTYSGGTTGRKMFVNGVEQTLSTQSAALNMVNGTSRLVIGIYPHDLATSALNGFVSNFKLWNVALTAEEVAMEYALGRTAKALNIVDTAVCIGGTAPTAQLDVRGSALIAGNVGIGITNPNTMVCIDGGTGVSSGGGVLGIRQKGDTYSDGITLTSSHSNSTRMYKDASGHFYLYNTGGGQLTLQNVTGKVGVGTNSFDTYDAFKVYNNLHSDGDGKTTFRVMHAGQIRTDRIGLGGEAFIMTDFGSAYPKIIYNRYGAAWAAGMSSASGGSSASSDFKFVYGSTIKAFFDANGSNNVDQNFTGQHRTFIKDVPFTEAGDLEGLIVSADQNKYIKMSGGIEAGSNAITTNESLPIVSRSTVASDKKCFGVVSSSEDPDTRKNRIGNFVSVSEKELGDTRVYINSVGEGAIWVTNINGNLESGDYITTSNVAGYGMKQDDDVLHNYTVAKITMDCDFSPATQPVQQIVKELGNVNYWVETTYSDVTLEEYSKFTEENRRTVTTTRYSNEEGDISPSEYSNLESNVQATYSEIETVTYQKIEHKESTTEQEGYTLEVREELVNVLDEHGQLQWEDHPTETEKAYKIRYLDADGKITTEANKVYTAAFVGCTYHCG